MIAIILMVAGGILAVLGFAGLAALMFEPVHTMYEVIFKRKADLVYYETKPGKALLQRNKNSLRNSCIFFLVVGLLLFGLGFFLKFGPLGTDSLFSKQVESGMGQGDAYSQNRQTEVINAKGNYVDAQGGEHANFIIVEGTNVKYRDEFSGSVEAFEGFVKQLDGKQTIYLVDEFASAKTYHRVEELLTYYGMTYEGDGE